MQERRKHKRVAVELRGSLAAGDQVLDVVVKDVSARGVLIMASERPPDGAPFTLRIDKLGAFDCEQKWWNGFGWIGFGFFEVHGGIYESLERLSTA